MPRERINGPGERYGTMRSYIKAGVGFDVAARSREFERKENYEPKEVTAYVSFDRHEIEMYRCVQPSIGFELFQNLASGLGTIDFNPIELLVFDEDIDSFIRKRSDPNEKKYDLSIVLEIDFVLSKIE